MATEMLELPTISSPTPEDREWQVGKDLGACMLEMYDKGLWADVKIRCKDQEADDKLSTISAHKIVLAARSPVFQAMFFGPNADVTDEVTLDHLEKTSLELFVRYLYSDSIVLTEETAPAVLEVAHLYQVQTAVLYCAEFLKTCIRVENACALLDIAVLYKLQDLKDTVCEIIDQHVLQILDTDGFMSLSTKGLEYLLKGNTFYAEEKSVFEKVIQWATKKCQETDATIDGQTLRKTLGDAFFHLRLQRMSTSDFAICTYKKGYFSFGEYEDILNYLIGHLSDPSPCVSAVSRNQRTVKIKLPSLGEQAYVDEGTCQVSFKLLRNAYLRSIKIANLKAYLVFGGSIKLYESDGKLIKPAYSVCRGRSLPFFNDTGLFLLGTLSCEDTNYTNVFEAHDFNDIEMKPHAYFKARKHSYKVNLSLQCNITSPQIQLITKTLESNVRVIDRAKVCEVTAYDGEQGLISTFTFEVESGRDGNEDEESSDDAASSDEDDEDVEVYSNGDDSDEEEEDD